MELDQYKNLWQTQTGQPGGAGDADSLAALLTKQSNSAVAKMKRNLLMELVVLCCCLGGVGIYYFIAFGKQFAVVSWVYLLLLLVFVFYYYKKNKLLNGMQCSICQVKSNLEKQVKTLQRYLGVYELAGALIVPAAILFLGFVLYIKMPSFVPRTILLHSPAYAWWQTMGVWALIAAITGIPFFYLNKKYIYKLYGKHVDRLKEILAEMEEE